MIILLGATGYIGQAFQAELRRRGHKFEPLSRSQVDYTRFEVLLEYLRRTKPAFLINAAGYTGKPNVDACEIARADTLQGNTLFPAMLAHACAVASVPWGHVSSGCIYAGAKVRRGGDRRPTTDDRRPMTDDRRPSDAMPGAEVGNEEGGAPGSTCRTGTDWVVEKDLTTPELRELFARDRAAFAGFTENDEPNFTFRQPPCSFYSGTKALGEEAIRGSGEAYVWRLRIPFDEHDSARNYLSKVQRYSKVYDNVNSISHRGDFVRACLDLWEKRAPFGIYNVTNPGAVTTRQVVETIQRVLKLDRVFEYWMNDSEFYKAAAATPRSNCMMDVTKLLSTGVKMRSVEDALEDALIRWVPEKSVNH